MTVTAAPLSPDCAHVRYKGVRYSAIMSAHRRPDGTLDHASLIAAAVAARKDVQTTEEAVNRGNVPRAVRERLTALQQADMDHRAVLAQQIPGWADALEVTRKEYPRCQRAKTMIRTARALGLWEPMVKDLR